MRTSYTMCVICIHMYSCLTIAALSLKCTRVIHKLSGLGLQRVKFPPTILTFTTVSIFEMNEYLYKFTDVPINHKIDK